ncbi:tyrosine-type recombinase/integrase [Vibrio nigripulchritudo]|uniref:tyrosine-type recombinase/integrase n=1 Tax=Vibrio nigripulchritudo TaxID=28173 RepID=UPI0005F9EAAE|nr:tyrosine-type recombinase/integrase [Vibrio nigripulchritudo]KJY79898.1 hypothetical protein TW74_05945 [Vibrio nigripulchritudo]
MAHLRYTTKLEINGTKVDKFPIIITENLKAHILSLEYFLHLRTSTATSTLLTYAQRIADFITQLEVDNEGLDHGDCGYVEWDEIDDNWIEQYKNELITRYGSESDNSKNYVGQVLGTVIAYLKWTQEQGYTNYLVGLTEDHRIKLKHSDSKKGDGTVHPLVKGLTKEKSPARTAPRRDWIDKVKANTHIATRELATRYELMIDWGLGLGLRAHEVCALTIDQLPLRQTAENAYINGENVFIDIVVSKGSKPKRMPVTPILVKRTWDFIERERVLIIRKLKNKAKAKRVAFVDSEILFPSSRTGGGIHPRTFSNQVRKAFLIAVEQGDLTEDEIVWAHGLRHRHATDTLKGLDDNGVKNPQRIAKHSTRHAHESTLDGYTVARFFEDS